jgi:hypothetical protein
MTDRPDLDERFEELVRLVAERSTAPPPAAVRGRARRHLAGQGAAALLLVAALVAAGLAVDRRVFAEPAPVGPAAPSTTAPPATVPPTTATPRRITPGQNAGPQAIDAALRSGTVVASGTSPKGMHYRLVAKVLAREGLCTSFQVASPGKPLAQAGGSTGCSGPESELTVTYGEQGGPSSRPAVPEVAVGGAVKGQAASVRLTIKRTPRDHRSPVAKTVTVPTIHKPGFQVAFLVAFIPVNTWVAEVTLLDANGRRICSQLGDDFKTPYLPGAMRCT